MVAIAVGVGVILATPEQKRAAAVELAVHATNGHLGRRLGDPVHEEITEGRRAQYERALAAKQAWAVGMSKRGGLSTCGDQLHWGAKRMGCRDERFVNRDDDGGAHPWLAGDNLLRMGRSRIARRSGVPCVGAFVCIDRFGGHVFIITSREGSMITCSNYGAPYGSESVAEMADDGSKIGHSKVLWWIDPADIECTAEYQPPGADTPRESRPKPAPIVAGRVVLGAGVSDVQAALKRLGFDPGAVDGVMGLRTVGAVRAFQAGAGLTADGIVGPITRVALAEALAR